MSQTRGNRSANTEPDISELEEPIKECVHYILCREGSKIPIKRAEIIKYLNATCETATNVVTKVIIEANNILKRVYGYKLVQVDSKSGPQYILVLTDECESLPSSVTDVHHRRILVAALTHIFMSGAPVKEEEMWKFLAEAGLLEENDHSGRKLLTSTFTRQMYLQYSKEGEGDLARNIFKWGQRAIEEVPKIFLLGKVAEGFGKSPDYWSEQFREANEEIQN